MNVYFLLNGMLFRDYDSHSTCCYILYFADRWNQEHYTVYITDIRATDYEYTKNCGACRFVFKGVAKLSKTGWKTHEISKYFDILLYFWNNVNYNDCVARTSSLNTKAFLYVIHSVELDLVIS